MHNPRTTMTGIALAIAAGLAPAPPLSTDSTHSGPALESFTGSHTKVVWITQDGRIDTYARGDRHQLWGLDSRNGEARTILATPGSYHRPLISPDGKSIVYSDGLTGTMHSVDWNGGNRRDLGTGAAAAFWTEPGTDIVYVYAQSAHGQTASPLVRFPFDSPEKREQIWNLTPVGVLTPGSFQLSRDGTRAATVFPWPISGVALLDEGGLLKHRDGCWPGMAPDDSHMHWTFDGSHKILFLNTSAEKEDVRIDLSQAPGIGGRKVYHPRWTNHVRFLVMTGPYDEDGEHTEPVNIHLGRFSGDFSGVEEWHQVTGMDAPAYFPDVWIDGGAEVDSGIATLRHASPAPEKQSLLARLREFFPGGGPEFTNEWPGTRDGLVFLWKSNAVNNEVTLPEGSSQRVELEVKGNARFGPAGQMHLIQGEGRVGNELAKGIAEAARKSNELTFEAILETHRAHQSGPARIVSNSKNSTNRNFMLGQEQDQLIFRLRTSDTHENGQDFILGTIPADEPVHVLVTYRPGELVAYINGGRTNSFSFEQGDLSAWKDYELIFGNELKQERFWQGYLDGVAIHNRFATAEEASIRHQLASARLADRPRPVRHTLMARAVGIAASPDPESIAPYRRALVINEYLVIDSGDPAMMDQSILVAEWALLDSGVPADYAALSPGIERTLVLEAFDAHPQLESERRMGETPDFEKPLFYHVFSGG